MTTKYLTVPTELAIETLHGLNESEFREAMRHLILKRSALYRGGGPAAMKIRNGLTATVDQFGRSFEP